MDYSKEQKENLYKDIVSYVAKSMKESDVTAPVTTKTLHNLVGQELDESTVIKNRTFLNTMFGHLPAAYGFEDFHDLYLYAMSCDQNQIQKSGTSRRKDTSKLNKVKRTVMRNGKPTEMTFYEDPNKDSKDNSIPEGGGAEEEQDTSVQPVDAKELRKLSVGGEGKTSTKDLAGLKQFYDSMGLDQPFYPDADAYTVLADENNNIMGMLGFSIGTEYITLEFSGNNELSKNHDIRAIFELAKEGLRHGKGIRTKHLGTQSFDVIVEDFDMEVPEEESGYYTLDKDKLFEVFGYDH